MDDLTQLMALFVSIIIFAFFFLPHVLLSAVFCACEINPRKTDASIFNGSQTLIIFNLIQFYNICRLGKITEMNIPNLNV